MGSEDNDNPSLIVADQIQSSPVTSNGTTIEEVTNQNKIAALQETIESQERDEEYKEKVVTKLKIKKNQREALQTTMQQIKHEPEGACQESMVTNNEMEDNQIAALQE